MAEKGKKTWKEKVLELMQARGMSQAELAKKSGVTTSSVSRYLHLNKRPRMDIVINFAKALQVEPQYFLDDEDVEESAYAAISTAIARKGGELTDTEKKKLVLLLLGSDNNV
ncbi:MAG: helix-turn-helix transcriptional regulator [Lachnospiraceae bacterium]|nr:helix-turn-helix transcriptional regulator [Lachnospiraceae bacterium]